MKNVALDIAGTAKAKLMEEQAERDLQLEQDREAKAWAKTRRVPRIATHADGVDKPIKA